jgi:ankyrin repeat protein
MYRKLENEDKEIIHLPEFNIIDLPYNFNLSPLQEAIARSKNDRVIQLLHGGADIDEKGFESVTPLHFCADLDHDVLAKLLLERGASVDVKDKWRRTPLHYCLLSKSKNAGELLIEHDANIEKL